LPAWALRTLEDHRHDSRRPIYTREQVLRGTTGDPLWDAAQYFTVRDERFERWVGSWVESGIVKRWKGRIRVLQKGDIRPENREQIRYVGDPGMNFVARHLSDSLSIRWGTCVRRIRKEGRAIVLVDEKGAPLGGYDALIVSTPPEQGVQLLSGATALVDRAAGVRMDPCWSVMLAFREPLDLDADGLCIHGSALVWAGRNSSKPGRGSTANWVLHAGSVRSGLRPISNSTPISSPAGLRSAFSMPPAVRPSNRCLHPRIAGDMPGQPTLWKKLACGTPRKKSASAMTGAADPGSKVLF
jgi:hypothetical protein